MYRFPRSTREAFPDERGQWFEPPDGDDDGSLRSLYWGLGAICLALAVWAVAFT